MFAESQTQRRPDAKATDPDWAWAPYRPDRRRPWSLPLVGHLYRRAAFGADWTQLQRALAAGPQRAVESLLRGQPDAAAFNQTYDEYEAATGSADALRAWWLRRMIHTPHPLLEKMTLFWHGHFAASDASVNNAPLMRDHVGLLRSHALGSFEPMLQGVCSDPATFLALDCQANRKAQPNENLARHLLDTYTLGPGNYQQTDVREAARALTGWFVLRGRLRYFAREHDSGAKRILGHEGDFDSSDVVRIVLQQPAAPRLLVRKIYGWLISETDPPDDALIAPLAESFGAGYDVLKLLETILRSNLFFSPAAYRRRIKGPVEFALGIVKGLEGTVSTTQLGRDLAALGQNLYHPPTVHGWPGGRHWINRSTLLGRANLALALVSGAKEPYGDHLDPPAIAGKHGFSQPDTAGAFLLDLFLQGDVQPEVRETLLKAAHGPADTAGGNPSRELRRFTHAVLTLPEFQLA